MLDTNLKAFADRLDGGNDVPSNASDGLKKLVAFFGSFEDNSINESELMEAIQAKAAQTKATLQKLAVLVSKNQANDNFNETHATWAALKEQVKSLTDKCTALETAHEASEKQIEELEEKVGQLSRTNDKLNLQLQEAPKIEEQQEVSFAFIFCFLPPSHCSLGQGTRGKEAEEQGRVGGPSRERR